MGAEGQSVAHLEDGMVVFVPFAAPGDVCKLQITKKRKKIAQGKIVELVTPGPDRRIPQCDHFGICGGCKWQHVFYHSQLAAKEQQVIDALERLGKVYPEEHRPILGCLQEYHYRNKVEFTFSNKRWLTEEEIQQSEELLKPADRYGLGFHIPGKFDKVLNLNKCHIAHPLANELSDFIRRFTLEHADQYSYFDLREQKGLMRTLMIRTASTGESMLLVAFAQPQQQAIDRLLEAIKSHFPSLTSLLYVINEKRNDTFGDLHVHCYHGSDHIYDTIEDLRFKISAKSFFQTNTAQAERLYRIARDLADLQPTDIVYDLYTGTGTIACFVAKKCKQVIGIEYVPEAIEDAKENSAINSIDNTLFYAGDMKDILTDDFIETHGKPDVIITDPPRAGMHEDVVKTILRAHPKRIVYVSCNPATQARDAALLVEGGYHIKVSQPVDLFPQTHHVENVLLFEANQ